MASNVWVVDSSFKRTQIKVTPGKSLREVLEEACKSRKLNPEEYTLRSQTNKPLDLSQPFRLSGLTAGAKLQLTQASKSPGVVSVALQLPESEGSGRLSDKFSSNTSLWLVLRKYEDAVAGAPSKKLNLTQRGAPSSGDGAGRLMYEQPCLHVAGRNFDTFTDLQKTLAQLGINSNSVLMRLNFKSTQTPLEEAMQEISSFFTSIDTVPAGIGSSASQDAAGTQSTLDSTADNAPDAAAESTVRSAEADANPEASEDIPASTSTASPNDPMDHELTQSTSQPAPLTPFSPTPTEPSSTINGISVYRPPTSSTPAAALHTDDPSVFEPTIDHAKSHQAALQQASRNKRLLSDKELEEAESLRQEKLATVQSVIIRVRYPDQSQIETTVYPTETAADLYAKVMDTLAAAPEPFELRYAGTKGHETLPNSATKWLVKDFAFRGKVLVTLVWGPEASLKARQGPSLKEEYARHAKDLKVELSTVQAEGEQAHRTALAGKEKSSEGSSGSGKGKEDLESKMKKFLGFKKK